MKPKNTRFTVIMVIFVVLFIVMPYFNRGRMARPGASKNVIETLTQYWQGNETSPEELIETLVREHDITFLGEVGKFHETASFITDQVRSLPGYGVTAVGVSFLNHADQSDIDRLMTGESFDADLAEELLFRNLVMNGYREYRDFMEAVWQVNADSGETLRLIGLNVELDWSVVQTNKDASDPAKIAKVYAQGVPDSFMARVIEDEIIAAGEKAVIYSGMQHALATLRIASYEEKMVETGFQDDIYRAAKVVKDGGRADTATVIFHAPWSVERSQYGIDYPLGGALDSFMEEFDPLNQRMGLLTEGTPFGDLPSAPGSFGAKESHRLSDFCDGYVLLGPIKGYTPFTGIPEFITTGNFDRAVQNFPGPKEVMPQSPRELNDYIGGVAANVTQILEKFEK